jgi:hypothetical protein
MDHSSITRSGRSGPGRREGYFSPQCGQVADPAGRSSPQNWQGAEVAPPVVVEAVPVCALVPLSVGFSPMGSSYFMPQCGQLAAPAGRSSPQ